MAAGCYRFSLHDMGYSNDALTLKKPKLVALPRSGDRLSYVHIDRAKVWQDDTGVMAQNERGEKVRLPIASLTVLMLGPGTSITTPAMISIHRAGCCILTTSDGGVVGITAGRPLAARARWAEAQARMWTDHDARVAAARIMYAGRFPDIDWSAKNTLQGMRGLEGHRVKMLYRQHASRIGMRGWRRDTEGDDLPNQLLNLANSILYGSALAAVSALGLNPALGVIHQGAVGALLFDLADLHKATASIPLAFNCSTDPEPEAKLRTRMRHYLHRKRVLEQHFRILDQVLAPHLSEAHDRLLDDEHYVPGHTNYTPYQERD